MALQGNRYPRLVGIGCFPLVCAREGLYSRGAARGAWLRSGIAVPIRSGIGGRAAGAAGYSGDNGLVWGGDCSRALLMNSLIDLIGSGNGKQT